MPVNIPVSNNPAYSQRVTLDGVAYNIRTVWNTRGEFWTMTIADSNGVDIVAGIKIVLNYNILEPYEARAVPPGEIWAVDVSGNTARIGRDDLTNGRIQFVYYTAAEIAAART